MSSRRRPPGEGLAISYRDLRTLVAHPRNSRTHTPRQIAKIKTSLRTFGWASPVLIAAIPGANPASMQIIAGHARVTAALALANEGATIPRNADPFFGPTVDLSHLSEAERRAYVIADNRLALDAGWDSEMLSGEMGWLKEQGFDATLTGFSADQIKDIVAPPGTRTEREIADGLRYQVVLDADDEAHQARLLEEFEKRGLKAKPLIM